MRLYPTLLLGLLAGLAAGCANDRPEGSAFLNRFRTLSADLGPDAVQFEIALIRQPLGDPYLSHDLWLLTDEQALPLEQRSILEANGLRVGTISGPPPDALQALLTSERSCVNARRIGVKAGAPYFLPLGPADQTCTIKIHQDGEPIAMKVEQAQCGLSLQPAPAAKGHVVLRFEPRVQHGTPALLPRPSPDRAGWTLSPGRAEETYEKAAWELSLAPNEYAIIGGFHKDPDTLGHHLFVASTPELATQDLLVIRTTRTADAPSKTTTPQRTPAELQRSGPLPLALQSILPKRQPQAVTRGQSPMASPTKRP